MLAGVRVCVDTAALLIKPIPPPFFLKYHAHGRTGPVAWWAGTNRTTSRWGPGGAASNSDDAWLWVHQVVGPQSLANTKSLVKASKA